MTTKIQHSEKNNKSLLLFLILTAFTCGTLIMVIEVIGSKVIGPFFGISLFVWTSLIAVTMISLALGYAIGGYLSDRMPSPDVLYILILLAGVFVLLIPLCKSPVLKLSMSLGLRAGSFFSCMVLFGPSLILLGCVSPYLIKIFLKEMSTVGRTVGSFYAISTVGSVTGTILTGFLLVAFMSVEEIFLATGTILILLTCSYFLFFKKKWTVATLLFLPLLLFLITPEPSLSKTMKNGTRVQIVAKKDSFYGNVKVVDYSYGFNHHREMIIDGSIQGGLDMVRKQPFYAYPYFLSSIPKHIYPEGKDCLVVGLGPGVIPNLFESMGVRTDVVDIDPIVVDMAQKHFGFNNSGEVYIEDARYYLTRNQKKYDYLILDVFGGDTAPSHIVSLEAFRLMKEDLDPRGVLGMNLVANASNDMFVLLSVKKTLQEVFQNVELIFNFDPSKGTGNGNISIFAYDGAPIRISTDIFTPEMFHPSARDVLRKFDSFKVELEANSDDAIILTDSFNPIDYYSLNTKEWHRKWIIDNTDWDILIQ